MPIEYKVISLTWGGSLPILEDELNRYGADGWDVVDLRWQQGSHDFVAVTMKRERKKLGDMTVEDYNKESSERWRERLSKKLEASYAAPADTSDA